MNITLDPYLEKLVQEKVESGGYQDASDVIRKALRLLDAQDHGERRERLEEALTLGKKAIEEGRVHLLTQKLKDQISAEAKILAASGVQLDSDVAH